jgi:hypothetical protein
MPLEDLLLICPPFTQLNTPYPATPYLKGFLNTKGITSFQMDLGIEVILELFSQKGLQTVFEISDANLSELSPNAIRISILRSKYLQCVEEIIPFLQGKMSSLARQICTEGFLPRASRFGQLEEMEWAFGSMGIQDKAKHLATLFLEDISDFIVERVDPQFGFSRYAEKLGMSANSFDELYSQLQEEPSYIDSLAVQILRSRMESVSPKLVCFTVPFPGNLYSAFRSAQFIRTNYPDVSIAMGGGFPNTELRELKDPRVFEFFHFISLDDGEVPIELLIDHVKKPIAGIPELKRTYHLKEGSVFYNNTSNASDYKQADLGCPDYSNLLLDQYISVIEMANPMHSLWSDGRWNKLTMAHGCYWGKCTFCDISLDYISLYEPLTANLLADRMEQLAAQTGESGFHFVDEAAPPALMKALALEILKRGLLVTWWANIRFEKSFNRDLCYLLKASGCIAVSGGLEVASDRLLALIDKGVTVEQVAQVTRNFTDSDIMVHAYLMYGYPTQTIQETVDSLEMVRQLFEFGVLQSGFWHQFALTAHSPIGKAPEDYGIVPHLQEIGFAHNDIDFTDSTGIDHSRFSYGLKKSLYNYMHEVGFDMPLNEWFDFKIPRTTIHPDYILDCIEREEYRPLKPKGRILWMGEVGAVSHFDMIKRKATVQMSKVTFHDLQTSYDVSLDRKKAEWLLSILPSCSAQVSSPTTVISLKASYEAQFDSFELFWNSKEIIDLRNAGLLLLL